MTKSQATLLPLEDQLQIQLFCRGAAKLNRPELLESLVEIYTAMKIREHHYRKLLRHKWGIEGDPQIKKSAKTLVLIAGVPGAGKTTLAETIGALDCETFVVAADNFFYDDFGDYHFDLAKLGEAHQWCQDQVLFALSVEAPLVLVHNTFSTKAEIEPYIKLAEQYEYRLVSLVVENLHGGETRHGVPIEKIELFKKNLKERFQP